MPGLVVLTEAVEAAYPRYLLSTPTPGDAFLRLNRRGEDTNIM
jgi:hypothetical protein